MRIKLLMIIFVALIMGGCTKNEFKISGNFEGAGTQNLRFIYYASDKNKGVVMESVVPVVNGVFQFTGIIQNPSIVWVFRPDRTLLNVLYVEKGNEVVVNGRIDKPYSWTVTGNDLQKSFSQWQKDNENLLMSGDATTASTAVEKYVKENPADLLSALLLMCVYTDEDRVDQRNVLWESLDESVRSGDLLNAVSGVRQYISSRAGKEKVHQLTFLSYGDTLTMLNPARSQLTILYMWRIKEELHKKNISALKEIAKKYSVKKQLQIADINLDRDTSLWRKEARLDSVETWERMWAVGSEMNKSISKLNIPRTPYYIVVDSIGQQIYRGDDAAKMQNVVEEFLKKGGK